MRLLHTETLQFQEFFDSRIPPYAILSHRWGDNEVTFKEMRKGQARPGSGFTKIQNACKVAAERGFEWAWIDTCCIDKRSSAELSEAINAMYKWYEFASEVYIHLSDFKIPPIDPALKMESGSPEWFSTVWPTICEDFRRSSWFTRGWTLQELLAPNPRKAFMFDAGWNIIGSVHELAGDIHKVTRIPPYCMGFKIRQNGICGQESVCIAKRMSWMAHRQTSREEDMAYCLLGIFDINMPLLYGEGGKKAFYRLQIEIMNDTDDESLFAWTSNQPRSGLIAASPSYFADSGYLLRHQGFRKPFFMTNKGLRLEIPKEHLKKGYSRSHALVYLNCLGLYQRPVVLRLESDGTKYWRINCDTLERRSLRPETTNLKMSGDLFAFLPPFPTFNELREALYNKAVEVHIIQPDKHEIEA